MSLLFYFLLVVILAITTFLAVKLYYTSILTYCTSKTRMEGKTVLVTGGSKGIGYCTALDLARRGARVIITSSDKHLIACKKAADKIILKSGNNQIITKYLDFCSLKSVRVFAEDIIGTEERLDVLINNAGTTGLPNEFSEDGLQMGLQVNYFGPFLLTHLLIDLLKKSTPSRIVNVASNFSQIFSFDKDNINEKPEWKFTLNDLVVYSRSKLFVVYMTWELAERLKDSGITVNCLHTGYVSTGIWNTNTLSAIFTRFFQATLFKTPKQGAQTSIHLAVSKELENVSGKYFDECKPYKPYIKQDRRILKLVWDKSVQLVKLRPEEIQV